jgi:hypothetical protein
MAPASSILRLAWTVPCLLLISTLPIVQAQNSAPNPGCGKARVSIAADSFLILNNALIAVELPSGWVRDESKSNPFFFLLAGDRYESARTLMYVRVQELGSSFEQAVKNDERDFRQSNPSVQILDDPQLEILEKGCPTKTQRFVYRSKQKTYVDQVTKIGINGLLLNVVLSSDSEAEIARYEKDYEFLLRHLGLVMHAQ